MDLPAEDLLKRLQEGKVYVPEQAARAAEGFFRPGNLIALRELALRKTAERVEAQMQRYRELHGVAETWPVAERLLVAVSSGPTAAKLVRAASVWRSACGPSGWSSTSRPPPRCACPDGAGPRLADPAAGRELGAETAALSGERPAEEILRYARRRNVSKIVVGKPLHSRWRDVLFGSVRDELVRGSGGIDIYVISGDRGAAGPCRSGGGPRAAISAVIAVCRRRA